MATLPLADQAGHKIEKKKTCTDIKKKGGGEKMTIMFSEAHRSYSRREKAVAWGLRYAPTPDLIFSLYWKAS